DFREMAPAGATRDMFLDDQGNADAKKSLTSHLASGTPGTVRGSRWRWRNTARCR
ncbi:gamma-glutamyltranspeptidase, partial [Salmonella enterica subsp. enterica serovar Heidelberg str. 607309-5]